MQTQRERERQRKRHTERATLRLVHHIETEKESREKETMQIDTEIGASHGNRNRAGRERETVMQINTEIGASDNINDVMKTIA